MEYFTLSELASLIKSAIQSTFYDDYWVIAEIAQVKRWLQHHLFKWESSERFGLCQEGLELSEDADH
jgi:exonuclease VII large subunit